MSQHVPVSKPLVSLSFLRVFLSFAPFWLFLTFFKFGASIHYNVLSPYGEQVFPIWLVGILVGGSALIQTLLDVPAGWMLDKYGYKKLLGASTLIFVLAISVLLFDLNKTTYILTLIGSAIGWLFYTAGTNAYISKMSPSGTMGRLRSLRDTFSSLGVVFSSAVMVFALAVDVKMVSLFMIIILLISYVSIRNAADDKDHKVTAHVPTEKGYEGKNFLKDAYRSIVKLRPASFLLLSTRLSAAAFYGIIWFVVPLLIARDINAGILGLGLGIFDFSVVILGFLLGKLVDRFDKKLMVLLGLVLFSSAGIILGFHLNILFLLIGFLATVGDEISSLSLWSWLYQREDIDEHHGLISGSISLFEDLGWVIGPVIAGFLYQFAGPAWTIAFGGIIVMINLILYFALVSHPLPAFRKISHYRIRIKRHKE